METTEFPNPVITTSEHGIRKASPMYRTASSEKLRRVWGEPDHKENLQDGSERWIYNSKYHDINTGVFLVVGVIPLPLFSDAGPEQTRFTVKENKVTGVSFVTEKDGGFLCGLMAVHGYTFVCGSLSKPDIEKNIPGRFCKCGETINEKIMEGDDCNCCGCN